MRGLGECWVTRGLNADECLKAIVLAKSLKRTLTTRKLVILIAPDILPPIWGMLQAEFDVCIRLEEYNSDIVSGIRGEVYAKLYCCSLINWSKVVFIDPNAMVVHNSDSVFDAKDGVFSTGGEDATDVFLVKPSRSLWKQVHHYFQKPQGKSIDSIGSMEKALFGLMFPKEERCIIGERIGITPVNLTLNDPLSKNMDELKIAKFTHVHPVDRMGGNALINISGIIEKALVKLWEEDFVQAFGDHSKMSEHFQIPIRPDISNLVKEISMKPEMKQLTYPEYEGSIAIVGMSCRFPGSDNIEEFWKLLVEGKDGIGSVPEERWTVDRIPTITEDSLNSQGGFLKCPVDQIDGKFFEASPMELSFMDPQQRLTLQVAWEALEDAGIDPTSLKDTYTGVYGSLWRQDYKELLIQAGAGETDFLRSYLGNSMAVISARISHYLGLTGPSIVTESGCSSSMVAVHLACKSLLRRETELSLACGVNLLLRPFTQDTMNTILAPDGHCKTFDADADGFGRAEGCGVLVLKRYEDTVRDGDRVWGLIRGTSVVQEGASRSLGTPTIQCEALAMQMALDEAGVEAKDVSFVETHGTGTPVGDPLEFAAVAQVFSRGREDPLIIGSVKTNIGHTESCAGIAGIIKVLLSLNHEIIPPHRNLTTLNPLINLESVPAVIPSEPTPWKRDAEGKPRIAGVSSFGITGTDAHAIIQETPQLNIPKFNLPNKAQSSNILTISAKTEEALDDKLVQYKNYLQNTQESLTDICFTANTGRAHFSNRTYIVGSNVAEVAEKLKTSTVTKVSCSEERPKICFLFTGQGSQYPGMAKDLYHSSPTFRIQFDQCDRILIEEFGISINDTIWGENSSNLGRSIYSQTSIFCVEYCLLKLWESWGVKPDFVLGHSLGEFAAAVGAGILTFKDALSLVAHRSTLIDALPQGKMLVLKESYETTQSLVKKAFEGTKRWLDFAAVNSADQTVLAGSEDSILQFKEFCKNNKIKTHILDATHAFHSRHMDPILETYRDFASKIDYSSPTCTYVSGMEGRIHKQSAPEGGKVDGDYWVRHTRESVRYADACKQVFQQGVTHFLELGPQPVLSALTIVNSDSVPPLDQPVRCFPSMRKNESNWTTILDSVGKLYSQGISINWPRLYQFTEDKKKVSLPFYPFQNKTHWFEMPERGPGSIHPLVGTPLSNASNVKLFSNILDIEKLEFLNDHAIGNKVVFPGAGFLEMCLVGGHGATQCTETTYFAPTAPITLENFSILSPLGLSGAETTQMQVIVSSEESGETLVSVYSKLILDSEIHKWIHHASATFSPYAVRDKGDQFSKDTLEAIQQRCSNQVIMTETYGKLAEFGLQFGPTFQTLRTMSKGDSEYLFQVKVTDDPSKFVCHPVISDAMFQAVMIATNPQADRLHVPVSVNKFIWFAKIETDLCFIHCKIQADTSHEVIAALYDNNGQLLAIMVGASFMETTVASINSALEAQKMSLPPMHEDVWRAQLGPLERRANLNLSINPEIFNPKNEKEYSAEFNLMTEADTLFLNGTNELYALYIIKCLHDLGYLPKPGESTTFKDFVNKYKILPSLEGFARYLLVELVKEGYFEQINPSSRDKVVFKSIKSLPNLEKVIKEMDELYEQVHPQSPLEVEYVSLTGKRLAVFLTGKESALPILFPENAGSSASAETYYRESKMCSRAHQFVAKISPLLFKYAGKVIEETKCILRILEVGAGTGSFTKPLLEHLEEHAQGYEYTYTDLSPIFFENGRKIFKDSKVKVNYGILNVEQDPVEQGFIPNHYDLVIAKLVLHATKDVTETISNLRNLVRENGIILISESIKPARNTNLTFGCIDGYWRFQDFDLRPFNCELTCDQWKGVLQACDFPLVSTYPVYLDHGGTIFAQAGASSTYKSILPKGMPRKRWLLFGNDDGMESEFFIKQLDSFGGHVIPVYISDSSTQSQHPNSFSIRTDHEEDIQNLFKRVSKESSLEGVIFLWGMNFTNSDYSRIVQPFLFLCKSLSSFGKVRLLVVTREMFSVTENGVSVPQASPILAMTKCLQNEQPALICRCVDLDNTQPPSEEQLAEALSELMIDDGEIYVAYRSNQRFVSRCRPWKVSNSALSFPKSERFHLVLPPTNSIADLKFGAMDKTPMDELNLEVRVTAFALNFRDVFAVLKPSVEFETLNTVGIDYTGVVTAVGSKTTRFSIGDSVFGLNIGGDALPSHIITSENVIGSIPQGMTYCEAATIPAVAATAYMCLIQIAKLTKDDTILIHTASGGVGILAIQIAQSIGATIIATAGSKRKRAYLRNLGIKYIYHSRNTNYGEEIRRDLEGKGVDVVLNSLTSAGFKEASLKVCNPGARFIEMSKLNTWTNEEVAALRPDVKYDIVDLSAMDDFEELMEHVRSLMVDSLISPIPYVRFDASEIREALTYLQKAKHIGKIVCVMPESRTESQILTASATPNGLTIPMFNDQSTYLITGGLGGIGMEVAKWMVQTGAKNLVLVGRSIPNEKAVEEIGRMNLNGNNVLSLQYDVGDRTQCQELLGRIKSAELNLPQLRGVMHAAGVLSDAIFSNQTWEKYQTTFNPKVNGGWNLHELTLNYPLEHFVMFSSAASSFGTLGQSNHASANFFLDSLATYRNSIGLPANTVNWGQWGQVGVAANIEVVGVKSFSTLQGISALERVMKSQKLQVCVCEADYGIFRKAFPSSKKYLEELKQNLGGTSTDLLVTNEQFLNDYDGAESEEGRLEAVKNVCRAIIRNILKLDKDDLLNDDDNFQDIGMDSLMMIEMKNVVQSTLGKRATITVNSVKDCNTISLLSDRLCQLLSGVEEVPPPTRDELIELIKVDSQLPQTIQLPQQPPVKPSEIQILFMTGVTGNLGPYLLRDISQRTSLSKIYVLVRGSKDMSPEERLQKELSSKGLLDETRMDKVVVVQGSMTQPNLGMDEETYDQLSETVEGVIHLAVKCNFSDVYKKNDKNENDMRTVNVNGTLNLLEFVAEKRTKLLFHASSIVASGRLDEEGSISEEWPLEGEFDETANLAYPISKYVCDRLMAEAVERGFPIKVFRFPAVGGDSSSGANFNYDNNQLMLRLMSYLHLGIMPSLPIPFFILPVDICSSLSLQIFFDDHTPNELYNVYNPHAHSETDLVLIAEDLGCKVDIVDPENFQQKMNTYEDSKLIHFLKDFIQNEDAHERYSKNLPIMLQAWERNSEKAFLSKKLCQFIPEYPSGVENSLAIIKRDLLFAKKSGVFAQFGI